MVYNSNSPTDPFYLKSPIPFIWSMASLLNWKMLQTEKQPKTFLIKEGNGGEISNSVRKISRPDGWVILTSSIVEQRNHDWTWFDLCWWSLPSWSARLVHLNPALVYRLQSTVHSPHTGLDWTVRSPALPLLWAKKINAITWSGVAPLLLGLRQIVSEINSNF